MTTASLCSHDTVALVTHVPGAGPPHHTQVKTSPAPKTKQEKMRLKKTHKSRKQLDMRARVSSAPSAQPNTICHGARASSSQDTARRNSGWKATCGGIKFGTIRACFCGATIVKKSTNPREDQREDEGAHTRNTFPLETLCYAESKTAAPSSCGVFVPRRPTSRPY